MRAAAMRTIAVLVAAFCLRILFPGDDSFDADNILIWSHHEKNYGIYSPQLSLDNQWLVFTRKLHSPDGSEFEERVRTNPRIEDPEVVLMNIANKSMQIIDYGWNPVFSPDQKTILYAHQTQPLSGHRLYATTFAGNEIRAYNIERNQHTTVARPLSGYLSRPAFTDTGTVLFALSGATNGVWSDDIGVGMVEPATGQQKILYEPMKEHDRYHLVHRFAMQGNTCYVLRARPVTTGLALADRYAYELVDATQRAVLYSWGEHESSRWSWNRANFSICPSAGLYVYDGRWKALASKKTTRSPRSSGLASHKSPDCSSVAVISDNRRVLSIFSAQGKLRWRWNAPKLIRSLAWSPDSSYIALVLSQTDHLIDARFEFDELVMLRISGSLIRE